jgi:hypothetical protein
MFLSYDHLQVEIYFRPNLIQYIRFLIGDKQNKYKTKSVASVRERTISTEWPPLVSEVSANFYG